MALTNNAMNDLVVATQNFFEVIKKFRELKDRYDADNTVFTNQTIRADIQPQNVAKLGAAFTAIGEILFTLESGDPTQKSKLYELL